MTESDLKELEASVESLVRAVETEQLAARRASRGVIWISAALFGIVGVFLLVNYQHFKHAWTEEKLAAGFEKELQTLQPAASEQLQALGNYLLPIYAKESRRQFLAMTPEISRRLEAQFDQLSDDLQREATTRLYAAEDRITQRTSDVLFASYPAMKDAAERERLNEQFRATADAAVRQAAQDFIELFAEDIGRVEQKVHDFHPPVAEKSEVELQKRFIRLWLQLLDMEVRKT